MAAQSRQSPLTPKIWSLWRPIICCFCARSHQCHQGYLDREDQLSCCRWRQVQYLADIFWKRWSKEYLLLLQGRQKWLRPRRNLAVGDIVLVSVENSHRNFWPLGRIVEVLRDKKGFVRRAKVSVKSTILDGTDRQALSSCWRRWISVNETLRMLKQVTTLPCRVNYWTSMDTEFKWTIWF